MLNSSRVTRTQQELVPFAQLLLLRAYDYLKSKAGSKEHKAGGEEIISVIDKPEGSKLLEYGNGNRSRCALVNNTPKFSRECITPKREEN